ncbi:hypothetical protein HAX54_026231 [Datura stramonium]|uniref:Uncharacterized protein n=1 Tax=Datura stramonium TaxID=4076 RepID=A0ABS8S6V9_DATST|nr:hypothetical protein [Datura stramonium]
MISQFFVLSQRGDSIVFRDYRGDVPKGSAEIFFRKVKFWKEDECGLCELLPCEEIRLALNEDLSIGRAGGRSVYVILDDCNFHESVHLDSFDVDRTLTLAEVILKIRARNFLHYCKYDLGTNAATTYTSRVSFELEPEQ